MSYLFLVSLHVVGIESEYFVVRTIWTCGSITPAFFIFFLKRFFASFLGSSSGAVRTVFLSIAHRTTVHSSTRKVPGIRVYYMYRYVVVVYLHMFAFLVECWARFQSLVVPLPEARTGGEDEAASH